MKVRMTILCGLLAMAAAAQADPTKALPMAAAKTDAALVLLRYTVKNAEGKDAEGGGMALCIDAGKGLFMTTALPGSIRPDEIVEMKLQLPGIDRKEVKANFVGLDRNTGLGFVQAPPPSGLKYEEVKFASGSKLQRGQLVVSSGLMTSDPSLPQSVGMGYVSAQQRLPGRLIYITGGKLTAVGSPVMNAAGEAIGLVMDQQYVNYETVSRQGPFRLALRSSVETSFFVPVEEFREVLDNIPQGVRRPSWIGVRDFSDVDQETTGVDMPAVKVGEVIAGAPAAKAGMRTGDIIIKINGKNIEKLATPDMIRRQFSRDVYQMPAGKEVKLTVLRNREEVVYTVSPEPLPKLPNEAMNYSNRLMGLGVRERVMLDKHLAEGAASKYDGLIVVGVARSGAAASAGLKPGDLVIKAEGQDVSTVSAFKQICEKALKGKGMVELQFRRGEGVLTVRIKPVAG